MATIGLDKLYYAPITADANGYESYGQPVQLAKAISASLTVEVAEGTLYADDALSEKVSEFKSGKLTLGIADIGVEAAQILTGARVDSNGVLASSTEDTPQPVAIGFRAKKSDGTYRYFWLYKVLFSVPGADFSTKGDSITFSTPSIEGTIMRRNMPDIKGKHLWKVEMDEVYETNDAPGIVDKTRIIIEHWYNAVYEPSFPIGIRTTSSSVVSGESVTLSVDAVAEANQYEWYETFNGAEKLLTTTTSNVHTTEPLTTLGEHVFCCKIHRPAGSLIISDSVTVTVTEDNTGM